MSLLVRYIPVLQNLFAAVCEVTAFTYAQPKSSAIWIVVTILPELFLSHISSS